ncbi:hypothetical protein CQW23_31276 [Capsicum baccatum]|uniref:Glabrous enhancer-binding protein-like DBD domain-containing protein n=1 Tax=Capsicum baccatum TaxID=33114 RepID=A0A2G2V815_CAPBA|nr:hypothetical protein CQW23_31276 [Capsicum baccatum]
MAPKAKPRLGYPSPFASSSKDEQVEESLEEEQKFENGQEKYGEETKEDEPPKKLITQNHFNPYQNRFNFILNPKLKMGQDLYPNLTQSKADQVALLRGKVKYKEQIGIEPKADISTFYEFIKEKLQANVSKSQLSDKIRTLQKKFMKSVKDGEMMVDDKAKVLEEKCKKLDDAKATLILNHLDFIREHCGLVVDGMRRK